MQVSSPSPIPSAVLSSLDVAVLEFQDDAGFELVGEVPQWLLNVWPDHGRRRGLDPGEAFLMVDHFLPDARDVWDRVEDAWCSSGPWTQTDEEGHDWMFEAVAMRSNGHRLLLIKFPTTDHDTLVDILQKSRVRDLEYARLIKEINKREVLLHCIVHDLSTPLAGIKGSLMLLAEDDMIRPAGADLFTIALNQVNKMQGQIKEILHTFAEEVQPLVPSIVSRDSAPPLVLALDEVISVLEPLAERAGLTLHLDDASRQAASGKVAVDVPRLERVLFNLAENALRFAPRGSTIRFDVQDQGEAIRLAVRDEGPGVSEELAGKLFEKFSQGATGAGKSGLGLYFCKITVEGWGGSVGYEPNTPHGASFWIRLPAPAASD